MKSRKLTYPQALVMLATLVTLATLLIHVGLAAQERGSAKTQNSVSLINDPLLPDAAIPASAGFAVSVDGSPNGTWESPGSKVILSPTSLDFVCSGKVCTCTPPQVVTLTNNGRRTLEIASIFIGGFPPRFFETNTCGTMLGAGKSCGITVSWNTLTGSGTLTVSDNAPGSPQTASLAGFMECPSQSGSSRSDP